MGYKGRRKYSFAIDQSRAERQKEKGVREGAKEDREGYLAEAFASIAHRCSDRLFSPLNSVAFVLPPG